MIGSSSSCAADGGGDPHGCQALKETKEYLQLSIMNKLKKLAMEVLRLQDVQESYEAMAGIVDQLSRGHEKVRKELQECVDDDENEQLLNQFDRLNECDELAKGLVKQFRNKMSQITEQIKEIDNVSTAIEGITSRVTEKVASITSEDNYEVFFKQFRVIRDKDSGVRQAIDAQRDRKRKIIEAANSNSSASKARKGKDATDLSRDDFPFPVRSVHPDEDLLDSIQKMDGGNSERKEVNTNSFHAHIYAHETAPDPCAKDDISRSGGGHMIKELDAGDTDTDDSSPRRSPVRDGCPPGVPAPARPFAPLGRALAYGTNLGTKISCDEQLIYAKRPVDVAHTSAPLSFISDFVPGSQQEMEGIDEDSLEVIPTTGIIDLT